MKLRQLCLGLLVPLVWVGCASGGQPDVRLPSTERTGWVAVPQRVVPEMCLAAREESGIVLGIAVSRSSFGPVFVNLVSRIGRFTEALAPVTYRDSSSRDTLTRRVAWELAEGGAQLNLGAGDSRSVDFTLAAMLGASELTISPTINGMRFSRAYRLRGLGAALNAAGCRRAIWTVMWPGN